MKGSGQQEGHCYSPLGEGSGKEDVGITLPYGCTWGGQGPCLCCWVPKALIPPVIRLPVQMNTCLSKGFVGVEAD